MCVDIEYVYESMLQCAYGFSGNIKSNLKDIPVHLLINNIRYVLSVQLQSLKFKKDQNTTLHIVGQLIIIERNEMICAKKQNIQDKIYQT